jgi:hypothetical protein
MIDPADDRDDIEDSEIAQTVYDMDCEEVVRELAFIDSDADLLKWARNVKQQMIDAAYEARNDVSDGDE